MKTTKMSLANMQGKLSRTEMKDIMAGTVSPEGCSVTCGSAYFACCCSGSCSCYETGTSTSGCTSGGAGSTSCSA